MIFSNELKVAIDCNTTLHLFLVWLQAVQAAALLMSASSWPQPPTHSW